MSRNLKTLGLAMVAVLALSAAVAQAASAAAFNSGSASGRTNYSGSQVAKNVFKVNTGKVKCETATFTGTVEGNGVATVQVHPVYGGCTLAGQKAEVVTNNCNYEFSKASGAGTEAINSNVNIVNEGANNCSGITVSKEGCTVTVPKQNGLSNVLLQTQAGRASVLATAEVEEIEYTESAGSCNSPGTHENGEYTGSVSLTGTEDPSGVATTIWVE